MMIMAFLFLCIAAASSHAASVTMPNAELSIDWTSFQVTQYQGFPAAFTSTDLTLFVSEDGDWVDVSYNSLGDSDSNWDDWSGTTAVTGNQALAETTSDIIFTQVSLENVGWASSSATREGTLFVDSPGLVHISAQYNWSMWADDNPQNEQYANINLGLSAYGFDFYEDWSTWKYIYMGDWGNTTNTDGSGLLELYFMANNTGSYWFTFNAGVDVSAPPSHVPAPGSALMLFSGLIGLVMVRRKSA